MDNISEVKELLAKLDLERLKTELASLEQNLQNITFTDSNYADTSKGYNTIKSKIDLVETLTRLLKQEEETKSLLEDPDFKDIAKTDLEDIQRQLAILAIDLKKATVKPLENDDRKALMEFRPGVGGDEAAIFAEDLFNAYVKYSNIKGFKMEIVGIDYNQEGGISNATILVDDVGSYGIFRFEGGVHRVQRVPKTESAGRIHTSTASVVVMPKFEDVDIQINANDLRIEVYRSSGPGGQSVNTTDSAVRITHIPTKLTVTCQNGKSQHKNKDMAMSVLYSRLQEIENEKKSSSEKEMRLQAIQGGDRSSKIRTYNFPQGRITDHRINKSWYIIDKFLAGEIDEIIETVNFEIRAELERE
jgi:peptide chain release factor 1